MGTHCSNQAAEARGIYRTRKDFTPSRNDQKDAFHIPGAVNPVNLFYVIYSRILIN